VYGGLLRARGVHDGLRQLRRQHDQRLRNTVEQHDALRDVRARVLGGQRDGDVRVGDVSGGELRRWLRQLRRQSRERVRDEHDEHASALLDLRQRVPFAGEREHDVQQLDLRVLVHERVRRLQQQRGGRVRGQPRDHLELWCVRSRLLLRQRRGPLLLGLVRHGRVQRGLGQLRRKSRERLRDQHQHHQQLWRLRRQLLARQRHGDVRVGLVRDRLVQRGLGQLRWKRSERLRDQHQQQQLALRDLQQRVQLAAHVHRRGLRLRGADRLRLSQALLRVRPCDLWVHVLRVPGVRVPVRADETVVTSVTNAVKMH
jgi:hypothetical protein